MGVHRLFSRGGQNFAGGVGGGQKHTICLKMPKTYYFHSKKVIQHNILAGQGGGASAPSCPTLQTPINQS